MAPPKTLLNAITTRKNISLEIKMQILKRLETGNTISQIASQMILPKATIEAVCANKDKLMASLKSGASRKGVKKIRKMDTLLAKWGLELVIASAKDIGLDDLIVDDIDEMKPKDGTLDLKTKLLEQPNNNTFDECLSL